MTLFNVQLELKKFFFNSRRTLDIYIKRTLDIYIRKMVDICI